ETERSQRNIAANLTILSGDLLANDTGVISTTNSTRADNSYHVVSGGGAGATATLCGFTITGGNATGTGFDAYGGGMYDSGDPTLANIVFTSNTAVVAGGMATYFSSSTLTNITFSDNAATQAAGGMHNNSSNPRLSHVTFSGNR